MSAMRERLAPLAALFRQGTAPRAIAATLILGALSSVYPAPVIPLVFCTWFAVHLHLNMAAIHAVNWIVWPLQAVLFIPFVRVGEWAWRAGHVPLSLADLKSRYAGRELAIFTDSGWLFIHAATGWLLVAVPCAVVLCLAARAILPPAARGPAPAVQA